MRKILLFIWAFFVISNYCFSNNNSKKFNIEIKTTQSEQPPELTTTYPQEVTMTSARLGGNIINNGTSSVTERGIVWSTSPNPTIADNKTLDGTGSGEFISELTGLDSDTKYYIRAYATNSAGTSYGNEVIVKTHYGTVDDIDGNTYGTVKIGEQIWMAENLRVIHYNNGTSIPLREESNFWEGNTTEGYCWYNNDITFKDPYGAYYTKYSVNTGRLCPSGWHVSKYEDWNTLITFLGGNEVAGGKLKEAGTEHWLNPNSGATNEMGFNALPTGVVTTSREFWDFGTGAYFSGLQWDYLSTNMSSLISIGKGLQYVSGFPVRCVYGEESNVLPEVITKYPKNVTTNSVILGGNVTSEGNEPVIEKGIISTGFTGINKTIDGSGSGEFISYLEDLKANSTYYFRAYATNKAGTAYGNEVIVKTHNGVVIDIDGNTYGTVNIANQIWMAENLRVTHYNDGTPIPLITDNNQWMSDTSGYCWYNNEEESYKDTYGAIYKYNRWNLCPTGWHIPYYSEWEYLINYLGNNYTGKLKEGGDEHWNYPNVGATNETGFTALPGGFRDVDGSFSGLNEKGYFWELPMIAESNTPNANILSSNDSIFSKIGYPLNSSSPNRMGSSVRCILGKDTLVDIEIEALRDITTNSVVFILGVNRDGSGTLGDFGVIYGTSPNLNMTNSIYKKLEKNQYGGRGTYVDEITNLKPNTNYYIRATATNALGRSYGEEISFKTDYGTVNDIDGNIYGTIKIGEQIWMRENLKVTHFNNGVEIPLIESNDSWSSANSPGYSWIDYQTPFIVPFGALYNAYTINSSGLCPLGWHVPNDSEWSTLIEYLGGEDVAGGKLKEKFSMFYNISDKASDESGYSAVLSGYRAHFNGEHKDIGFNGNWWSSDKVSNETQSYWYVTKDDISVINNNYNVNGGLSVRCIEGDCQINLDLGDSVSLCSGEEETLDAGSGFDSYKWSTGATTQSIKVSKSGNYSVTVTDGNGCAETDMITVTVYTALKANAGSDVAIGSCAGQSATLDATGSTGTGLSYSWDNAATLSNANIANPMASPSVSTVYTVTITDSNGCTDTDAMAVTVEAAPVADAGVDAAIEICTTQSITLDATESMGTKLTYVWDNEGTLSNNKIPNPVASPAVTTTYKVTVTDVYGCMDNDAVKVTVNTNTDLNVEIDGNVEACFGEASTLDAGSGFDSYKWSTGETARAIEVTTSGDYSVTVTNGDCEGSDAVTVTFNSIPQVNLGETITACAGEIETLDAGSGFDSYKWSTGESTQSINVSESGTYWVKVWKGDCFVIDEIEVIFNSKPNVELGESIISCVGESEILDAGSGFDSYKWSTGETTRTIEVTISGDYSVTVINGDCEGSDAVTVTFNSIPQVNLGETITACAGETETLDAGSGFDSYKWSTGETTQTIEVTESGVYSVTVSQGSCDASDAVTVTFNSLPEVDLGESITACAGEIKMIDAGSGFDSYYWSTGETIQKIGVIESGEYSVTVTNEYGCTDTDIVTVTVNSAPTANAGDDVIIGACAGQTATLDATGSSGSGLSYMWNNAATLSDASIANPDASPEITTTYTLTVTNVHGCSGIDDVTVTVDVAPSAIAGPDATIGSCAGQTTILDATGSIGTGLTYAWDNEATLSNKNIANPVASPGLTTTYTVTITDVYGCTDNDAVTVTVDTEANLDVEINGNTEACLGETSTLDAGIGFESYKWSTGETTQTIDVTESGIYSVTVTQGTCEGSDAVAVSFNGLPAVELGESITACSGDTETLDAGSGFDSYKWSTGEITQTINVTESGIYSVTVTQGICEDSDGVTVTFNGLPVVELDESITACEGEPKILDAGSGFDTYHWSTGEITQVIEVTESGNYSVTVTQASCEASEEVMVMFHSSPIIDLGNDTSIFTTDILELTPGSGYVAYKWNDGSTGESYIIQNEIEGLHEYSVEVTDINSCKDSDTIFVTVKLVNSISAYMDNGLVKIYPNPTKDFVYIKSEKAIESNVLISVYDLSGQLLLKKEFDRLKENYNYEIDLSKYKSGMFLFHVIDDSGTVEFSVVKY